MVYARVSMGLIWMVESYLSDLFCDFSVVYLAVSVVIPLLHVEVSMLFRRHGHSHILWVERTVVSSHNCHQ